MSRRLRSSILMTVAPKSARRRVASEPTPIQQKSVTVIPARGPDRCPGRRAGFGYGSAVTLRRGAMVTLSVLLLPLEPVPLESAPFDVVEKVADETEGGVGVVPDGQVPGIADRPDLAVPEQRRELLCRLPGQHVAVSAAQDQDGARQVGGVDLKSINIGSVTPPSSTSVSPAR